MGDFQNVFKKLRLSLGYTQGRRIICHEKESEAFRQK